MAASATTTTKARPAKAADKDKAAKAKAKEQATKAKEQAAKEKEKAAKAKAKEKADRDKAKEQATKAKEQAAKAKAKAKADRDKDKDKAKAKKSKATATSAKRGDEPADPPGSTKRSPGGRNRSIHPAGEIAARLGKEDAVSRSTKRPTIAASFTTTDHDIVREWAQSRGGRPASAEGTESGEDEVGVLRIEFPEGPDGSAAGRLAEVDWEPFFAKFESSGVALLYQEKTSSGETSRFHKFVAASS